MADECQGVRDTFGNSVKMYVWLVIWIVKFGIERISGCNFARGHLAWTTDTSLLHIHIHSPLQLLRAAA